MTARCNFAAGPGSLFPVMKKPVRPLLLTAGFCVVALLVAAGLAFNSGVQTWAARRALAGQPQLKAKVGRVAAGFQAVALHDIELEQNGAVITLPSVAADLSVIDAGLKRKINLRRLVAKGWRLDLTGYRFPGAVSAGSVALAPAAVPAAALQVFQGVFAQAALPFDLTLDGVELEGDVTLPPSPGLDSGRAHVVLRGGGLGAGREGAFTFTVTVALTGAAVPMSSLSVSGRLAATMDTPRTFSRLATQAEAAAQGPQFPNGVKLATDLVATRAPSGEGYTISLSDGTRLLAGLKADWPAATRHLAGTWKLDVRDTDLAPFALGRLLPVFAVAGEGQLEVETATGEVRATGKLNAAADRLGVVQPEFSAMGAVRLTAEFDLARRGDTLRVERLVAAFAGARPVADVRALQPFAFNARSGELKVADPARDLLGLTVQGLPLGWVQPFVKNFTFTGGDVRGDFVAIARNGGFSLRPTAPLLVADVAVARAGQPLLRAVDFSLHASADYTPQGWQAELAPLVANRGTVPVLTLDAKAGQLLGANQPIKVAGKFVAHLPALLTQPAATGPVPLLAGEATGDFVASFGRTQEIQATLALTKLAVQPAITKETLPSVSAEVRADIAANGVIGLNLPLRLERDGRTSDLTLAGTLTPVKTGLAVEARVSGALLVFDDAQLLAGLFAAPAGAPAAAPKPAGPDAAPPWSGLSGQLKVALKQVVYAGSFHASDVTGSIRLDAGEAKLVDFRGGVGDGADVKVHGGVTFDAKSATPYALAAELGVTEFDPAPLFRAVNPGQPATVEGKFSVASRVSGRAATLADFATAAHGEFQLTSRGGVFRGLPVTYAAKLESAGKIAAGAAAIGNLLGSVTGKKGYADIVNKAQAVTEVSRTLAAISYDQLNVVFSRDAALNTVLKDFTLISPELRLSGAGQATHRPGAGLLADALAMEFTLRTRGRAAELLKYLGALESQADDLGYAACTVPLKISGTLAQPDPSEVNRQLAALALEKSGVTDKASELFNKLLGGGK